MKELRPAALALNGLRPSGWRVFTEI